MAEIFNSSSSDWSSDSESEFEIKQDLLKFSSKITEELGSCFRRNLGKEDYCDDIYEDMYSTPECGSYSYYTDLLAVAQSNDSNADLESMSQRSSAAKQSAVGNQTCASYCSWTCSGHRNSSVGAGPLEDLFRVLEPLPPFCLPSPSVTATADMSANWPVNSGASTSTNACGDVMASSATEDDYPNFIDVFHRWTSDAFMAPYANSFGNDYRTFGDY